MHINEKQRGVGSCFGGAQGVTAWGGGGDNQCEEVTKETGRGLWDIGWGQEGPPRESLGGLEGRCGKLFRNGI